LSRVVEDGVLVSVCLGHEVVDDYLRFVAARCRPNTLLATAYDLKVFFTVVGKDPVDVVTADVFAFITAQREPRRGPKVVRLEDGERGLSARTIKRRLATVSGLFAYLVACDVGVASNPVPRGIATRVGEGFESAWGSVAACPADVAEAPGAGRGRRVHRRAAHSARQGDGGGDAVGRVAAVRGARSAAG
jgi:hypothetical protein